jgi:iron complex outermembrane receptor protein
MLDLETGLRRNGANWNVSANFFWMQYRNQLVLDGRINDVGAYIRTNVPDSWRSAVLNWKLLARVGDVYSRWQEVLPSVETRYRSFTEYRDNWDTGAQEAVIHRNTDLAFSPNFIARGEMTFI